MAVTPDGGDTSESSTPPSSERMAAFPRKLKTDYYYHLGLDTDMDLQGIFGNVKFVVLMGSAARAEFFAEAMANAIVSKSMPKPAVARLGKTERYSMYKVGPVIAVSHGMGGPSLHILVNELAKLCDRAGIIDSVKWIRMGTSGGCGVPPGTVVVTTQAMNEEVEPFWRCVQLGKVVKIPTDCVDMSFVDAILESVPEGISAVKGKTMAADDFYEGQGRLDGALETWYNEEDKMAFMKRLYDAGVRNIEMESVAMMGFCNRANITAACVCVTIVDRLKGDQITSTKRELSRFNEHSIDVVSNFIAGAMSTTSTPAFRHNISPYAQALACDHYYHLGLDTDMDLQALFGDVKYFVMMGSPTRAETFAEVMANAFVEQGLPKPTVMRLGKTE
ncbi:Uridine phosphorylase 2, partial [Perkinsus olseni]